VFADLNERLPFEDATFDTVICLEGIEHVLDPQALIGELVRLLRPGVKGSVLTIDTSPLVSTPSWPPRWRPGRTKESVLDIDS
jgi:ubiquinone/menaquinone biosynthesis C-methylase UbiE